MRRTILSVLLLAVIALIGALWDRAEAASYLPRASVSFDETCGTCENGPTAFCFSDEHDDTSFWPVKTYQGIIHNCANLSCANALGHSPYAQQTMNKAAFDVATALAAGTESALLRVLEEHSEVELNLQRNAIQVVGDDGTVWLHAPLQVAQGERLAAALDHLVDER